MGSIFIGVCFYFAVLTTILYGIYQFLDKKGKLEYFTFAFFLYLLFLMCFNYFVTYDAIVEYNSYNKLNKNEIQKITVDNEEVNQKDNILFFKELKVDEFTLVNHPDVIKTDTVVVYTKTRKYKFIIENTSNQGVLVERINKKGNNYVTNRNDRLLKFVNNKKTNTVEGLSIDELFGIFDSIPHTK